MIARVSALLCLCTIVLTSCAHPNRISVRALDRLTKSSEKFVLVFGSLSTGGETNQAALLRPTIRFIHQAERSDPEQVLWSLTVSNGDRFYAALQTPPGMPFLDTFYAEVGGPDVGFDRITFVRLRATDAPRAMYFGEIRVNPAQNRSAQGERVIVNITDDFQNAEQELRRLYPHFTGPVMRAGFVRNPAPAATPERIR
jgi:hypothetical protein